MFIVLAKLNVEHSFICQKHVVIDAVKIQLGAFEVLVFRSEKCVN